MTIAPSSSVSLLSSVGGSEQWSVTMDIAMMIGVGLVKDSDAVFFQYLGDDQKPLLLCHSYRQACLLVPERQAGWY